MDLLHCLSCLRMCGSHLCDGSHLPSNVIKNKIEKSIFFHSFLAFKRHKCNPWKLGLIFKIEVDQISLPHTVWFSYHAFEGIHPLSVIWQLVISFGHGRCVHTIPTAVQNMKEICVRFDYGMIWRLWSQIV